MKMRVVVFVCLHVVRERESFCSDFIQILTMNLTVYILSAIC